MRQLNKIFFISGLYLLFVCLPGMAAQRFPQLLRDSAGVGYRLYLQSEKESIQKAESSSALANEGDPLASGNYYAYLQRPGWKAPQRQATALFSGESAGNNVGMFNLKEKQVHVLKGQAKGQPDLLVIEQHGGSVFSYARLFYVHKGALVAAIFKEPGCADSHDTVFYFVKSAGRFRISTHHYYNSATEEDEYFGWETKYWRFDPGRKSLVLLRKTKGKT